MDYHIEVKNTSGKWEVIASFENMCDRDDCKSFLEEKYEDCKFRTRNN
jgi:hypothetical protein